MDRDHSKTTPDCIQIALILASELQGIMKYGCLGFETYWMIQKKILEKFLVFTQNRSIRKNNMFWATFERSTFFPLSNVPDLEIFRSKNEILDFGHFIEFVIMVWLDIA